MHPAPPESAQWIEDHNRVQAQIWHWWPGTVGTCIPPVFEGYCKILHPFQEAIGFRNVGYLDHEDQPTPPLQQDQPAEPSGKSAVFTRITMTDRNGNVRDLSEESRKFLLDYKSKIWSPVPWKTVSERYGIVFNDEVSLEILEAKYDELGWDKQLLFPWEGKLLRTSLISLVDVLRALGSSDQVYIYQTVPHTVWKNGRSENLVVGNLNEVLEYFTGSYAGYMYASDRSWIIYTDADLRYTLVGGTMRLIHALLASDLEVLPCSLTTYLNHSNGPIKKAMINDKGKDRSVFRWLRNLFV